MLPPISSPLFAAMPSVSFWASRMKGAVTLDHQWSLEIENYDLDVTLTYPHDTSFTDVCWAFTP